MKGERDFCISKIDKTFNTAELVPKGLKEVEKKFVTGTGFSSEQEYKRRINFLKDSLEFIEKKEKVSEQLNEIKDKLKDAREGLPELFSEID